MLEIQWNHHAATLAEEILSVVLSESTAKNAAGEQEQLMSTRRVGSFTIAEKEK